MRDKHMFAWRLIRWLTPRFKSFKDARAGYSHRRRRWRRFCALVRTRANNLHERDERLEITAEEIVLDVMMAGDVLLWKSVFAQSTPADLFEFREWVSCNQAKLPEIKKVRGTERRLIPKWNLPQYDGFFPTVIGCDAPIYLPSRDSMESIINACAPLYTIRSPGEIHNWLGSCLGGNSLPFHGLEGLTSTSCVPDNHLADTETLVAPDCQKLIAKAWEWARLFRCLPKEEPVVKTPDEARRALDSLLIAIDAKLPAPFDAKPDRGHIDPPAAGQPDDQSEKQQFILAVQRMAAWEGIVPANDEENGWAFEPGSAIFRGTRFKINGKPLRLLKALVGGKPLTAADLRNAGWDHDEDPDDHAIGANLSRLRKLLRTALNLPKDADPVPCLDSGSEKAWQLRI